MEFLRIIPVAASLGSRYLYAPSGDRPLPGVPIGSLFFMLLAAAVGLGCFQLAFKGLSGAGIPLSKEKTIRGGGAVVIGAICLVLGLLFACYVLFGVVAILTYGIG